MEVGRITARLDALFDDSAFDKFDRRLDSARRESRKDVNAKLDAHADTRGFDKYNRAVHDTNRKHDDLVRGSGRVKTAFGSLFLGGAGVAAGATALYGLGKAGKFVIDQFGESQKVAAQTNAVLKSTGGAANVSAKEVSNLADAISKKSGMDDEAIQSGENLLLTFTNIQNRAGKGNDIFNQTTSIMADMSAALGQDTKSSAIQLGKALNDPIKGVTALQRVGVSFTQSQKDQIKTLVDSGKTVDAQKLILRELNKEFGGSAKAAGSTLPGALNKAKVALGNVAETIGGKLAPFVTKAANFVAKLANSFLSGGKGADSIKSKLAGVGAVFKTVGNVFRAIGAFIGKVIDDNRKTFDKFGSIIKTNVGLIVRLVRSVGNIFGSVFGGGTGVGKDIRSVISIVLKFAAAVAGVASAITKRALPGIITAFRGLATIVRGVIRVVSGILTLNFGKAWDGVKDIFKGAIRVIGGLLRAVTAPFREIAARIGRAILNAFDKAWDAIKSMFRGAVKGVVNIVRGIIDDAKKAASSVGHAITNGIDAVKKVPGIVKDAIGSAISFLGSVPGKFAHLAGQAASKFMGALINGLKSIPGKIGHIFSAAGGIISNFGTSLKNWVNSHTLLGDHVHIGIPGPVPDINFDLPALAAGGRVGPSLRGAKLFIAGEGNADEWVISQEGDRAKNIAWAREALEKLTGRRVDMHRRGHAKKKHKKRAPHFASASTIIGTGPGRADDLIANIERDMSRVNRQYGQMERTFSFSDEQFVIEHPDGSTSIDQGAVDARSSEIDQLIKFKNEQVKAKIVQYQTAIAKAIKEYQNAIKRIDKAVKSAKKRKASKGTISGYAEKRADLVARISELGDMGRELDLDITDVDLDVTELTNEKNAIRGQTGTAAPTDSGGGSGGGADTGGGGTPTAEEIATAAFQALETFNTNRAEVFSAFGSNFAPTGSAPFAGDVAQAAGARFFGAAGAVQPAGGDPFVASGANISVENHFQAPPPDPHIWSQGIEFELRSAI